AHVLAAKHAVPYMSKAGGGSIVNISSVVAFAISHEPCAYHVAKAGVVHLTRYLAYEFGHRGIRVNCVCPGLVDREEAMRLTDDPGNRAVVELIVPLKKAARSKDIAHAVLFLCTDEASYVTGQSLVVDGGLSLGEPFGVGRRAYQQASQLNLGLSTILNDKKPKEEKKSG
ncbi:SDR family oxidoreductase, partial [bacterium]